MSRNIGASLPPVLRIYPEERRLARRHVLAAGERLFRCSLDGGRHLRFHGRQLLRCAAFLFQVFLVQPDRISFPQVRNSSAGRVSRASRSSWVAWPPMRNVSAKSIAGPCPARQRSAASRVAAHASSTLLPSNSALQIP